MKLLLIIFLLILPFQTLHAQKRNTYAEVDQSTYQAYLNGDWDKVIQIGTQAIEEGTDYFYLRLRIGYAYFMKTQYRRAIEHYQEALTLNEGDESAMEYLYYSYLYAGRAADARCLVSRFPESLKEKLKLKAFIIFKSVGANITSASGTDDEKVAELEETTPLDVEGFQSITKSWVNYQFGLSHQIGNHVLLSHAIDVLNKDVYSFNVANGEGVLSDKRTIKQRNYHISANLTFWEGITFAPQISIVNYSVPVVTTKVNPVGKVISEEKSSQSRNETTLGARAGVEYGLFRGIFAVASSDFQDAKQNLIAAGVSFYPYANLDLYYNMTFFMNRQKQNGESESQLIHKHEVGYKINEHVWLEANAMFGDFTNLYDPFTEISYNTPERYKSILGVNVVVPFYNIGITGFLGYRMTNSESVFISYDNPLDVSHRIPFDYHSFTGGIIWNL